MSLFAVHYEIYMTPTRSAVLELKRDTMISLLSFVSIFLFLVQMIGLWKLTISEALSVHVFGNFHFNCYVLLLEYKF